MKPVLYHVGVSGGKDSSALLLWAIHESGLPREQLRVTFCDTGNEDHVTYAHVALLDRVAADAGIPGGIETITPPLQFFDLAFKKRRFPSRRAQFCTQHLKIKPTQAWLRARWQEGYETVVINGKRSGESSERKRSMLGQPERQFSDFWGCEEWAPLRDWTLADVLAIHSKYDVPLNPLYAMGARRVGCWPCINCGKLEIRLVAKHRPEKIDQIEREELRHEQEHGKFSSFPAKQGAPATPAAAAEQGPATPAAAAAADLHLQTAPAGSDGLVLTIIARRMADLLAALLPTVESAAEFGRILQSRGGAQLQEHARSMRSVLDDYRRLLL